jgi:predicted AAA+ superfamily ATPase
MIKRSNYLDRLARLKDIQIIKVLTGVRRSGKSTLLEMFRNNLMKEGVSESRIQYYNFEDLVISQEIADFQLLHDKIVSALTANEMNYIFIDEIQLVDNFEKALDSLFIRKNVDLYVTGSNANMLSSDIATLLSGRYIEITVFPLSFREYHEYKQDNKELNFNTYADYGGFPLAIQMQDEYSYRDYMEGIVNTVLIKDILSRKQRSDSVLVRRLAMFLVDTSGNLVNIRNIANTLTSKGKKTTSDTVSSYIEGFLDSYLFFQCNRFDITGKRYLEISAKYYPVDPSLRSALIGTKKPDLGLRLEGIVYLELLRRGYEVYVGQVQNQGSGILEVDFVAIKDGITEYYQVAHTISDEDTYKREVRSLKKINDNYSKIVLSLDYGNYDDEGIKIINVIDWLLSGP